LALVLGLTNFPFNQQGVKPAGTLKQAATIAGYFEKASVWFIGGRIATRRQPTLRRFTTSLSSMACLTNMLCLAPASSVFGWVLV
jgi:hypothetical protein